MEYIWAFLIGGAFCVVGQILLDTTPLTAPRILVIFVLLGVLLQAVQLYEPIVKLAGTGATVPLPGFGYALAKGAMEGAQKGFLEAHRTDQSDSSRCGGCDHLWLHDSLAV